MSDWDDYTVTDADGDIVSCNEAELDKAPKKCWHPNKYINSALFKRFWVCPDCKEDLGDAKDWEDDGRKPR